ncbi:MAG: matrixin family metalloprotease [Bryobacteraceae bacterium]
MWRIPIRLSLCVFLALGLAAQNRLRLKNLEAQSAGLDAREAQPQAPPLSRSGDRLHVLVQLDEALTPEQLGRLEAMGVRAVQYVPDFGYVFSVRRELGIGAAWRLRPPAKVSAALRGQEESPSEGYLVAEFFPDVDGETARTIARDQGFEVVEHPDMLPNHLLLRGRTGEAEALAEWDEVSYVFPASPGLVAGEHVEACPGAIMQLGPVGQYVATVGDGWDGPGRGSVQLGYFLQRLTGKLPADQARGEILRALEEWARVAGVSFAPADAGNRPSTVNVLFASGDHGDGYPFDGQGRVLAHTFYPSPPNPEPIAGDMHLDDDEEWVAGPDVSVRSVDLFSVTLHELGHALGLGHSDIPGAVMYPYYRRTTALTQEDVNAILKLYAAAGSGPAGDQPSASPLSVIIGSPAVFPFTTNASSVSFSGTAAGGTGDVQVTWSSDRTGAGVAQGGRTWTIADLPLQLGSNLITITATDSAHTQAFQAVTVERREEVQTPPSVSIVSPASGSTYATGNSTVTLAGTASPAGAISRVQWANSRGGGGTASGTSQWSAGPIPLQPGTNVLTVTAYDARGASVSGSLTVTYTAASDKVAPSLRITSPASTSVLTSAATIRLQGTASDNIGVAQVTWSTSFKGSGVAAGTSNWTTGDVPLLVGTNTIVVRAYDAAGNSAWRSVTVTRR